MTREIINKMPEMELAYSFDGRAIKLDTIRKMSDDELLSLLEEIHMDGYFEGYDDGYINARADCY